LENSRLGIRRARPDLALTFCMLFSGEAFPLAGNAPEGGGP
jgi:hypothetical protein